jgi:hypothetical protein
MTPHEENATMFDRYVWLLWVALAGLSWGVYVPIIFYGGSELGGRANARLMAILCVGIAYFLIGVVFPLVMFLTGQFEWPTPLKATGLIFSGLAGVAGAVGAICVIFASQSAVVAAQGTPQFKEKGAEVKTLRTELEQHPERSAELQPQLDEAQGELIRSMARYRLFIAPLIFGLAPVINTLVSLLWHPRAGEAFHFGFKMPPPMLWVGIILVGVGAALVLYSKESSDAAPPPKGTPSSPPPMTGPADRPAPTAPEAKP